MPSVDGYWRIVHRVWETLVDGRDENVYIRIDARVRVDECIEVADGDVGEGGFLPGGCLDGERGDGVLEIPRQQIPNNIINDK